jgi:putative copper resistance protein D
MIEPSVILAWPLITAQIVIFGTAAFALTTGSSQVSDGLTESLVVLWRALALIILIISPLRFLSVAANMADSTLREAIPFVPQIVRETFAGRVWVWRLGVVAMLAIAAWISSRRTLPILMAAISTVLLLFQSITSHAIDKGAYAIAIHFVHQVSAGLWFGALVCLLVGATYGHASAEWLRWASGRVSIVAGWSVAMLVVTGAIRAWYALGLHFGLLLYSLYGRTLLWKLATAATVILIGGYNRYRLVPVIGEASARSSLIRNVTAECLLLGAVLGWSALLAHTPPPH